MVKFCHTQPTGKLRFLPLNQHNYCYFVKGYPKIKSKNSKTAPVFEPAGRLLFFLMSFVQRLTSNPNMRFFRLLIRLVLFALLLAGAVTLYDHFLREPDKNTLEPVITHNTVLQQITRMGKLELVRYNFRDVVEYEKGMTSFESLNQYLDKASTVLIINGEAIGCIDLTRIQAHDIVDGDSGMVVYLPEPELCVYKINHEQSKVYDTRNTYFQQEGKMVNEAYAAAEKKVRNSALEMGILRQTDENARKILQPFLEKIAGKKVILRKRMKGDFRELDR